jgi:ubiquinone/menaquinone biosynthesis C-methylase UbiE
MEYYREHWVHIEQERLDTYDSVFQWNPLMEPMLHGFGLEEAACLVDYGTGPGWIALEMGRRMDLGAQVFGCDLNEQLLSLAEKHAEEMGLSDRVQWCHVPDDRIPLPDNGADRVFCRNTLAYVSSIGEMLKEFRRVLKPGGIVRMIDMDWDMFSVEPSETKMFRNLIRHAKHAFRDPQAGRHLYGAAKRAGFKEIQISMFPFADTEGFLIHSPLKTLVTYAKAAGFPEEEADSFIGNCEEALTRRELLIIINMFMVTGTTP